MFRFMVPIRINCILVVSNVSSYDMLKIKEDINVITLLVVVPQ